MYVSLAFTHLLCIMEWYEDIQRTSLLHVGACSSIGAYTNEKALKCKPSVEFGGNIGIFRLKTPLHAYVLGEHTSMKNEL